MKDVSFLSNNSILYKRQHGFRICHSTYMAVLDLIKEMNIAIDGNICILLEYSWTYQRHSIQLTMIFYCKIYVTMVLEGYPMSGLQVTSQIENRMFHIIQLCPQSESVKCGVPQGCILGPLLL